MYMSRWPPIYRDNIIHIYIYIHTYIYIWINDFPFVFLSSLCILCSCCFFFFLRCSRCSPYGRSRRKELVSASSRAHMLASIGTSVSPGRDTRGDDIVRGVSFSQLVELRCSSGGGGRRDCAGRTSRRVQISSNVGRDVPSSLSRATQRHAPFVFLSDTTPNEERNKQPTCDPILHTVGGEPA